MTSPTLIGRHVGETVRVRLAPRGSIVGTLLANDGSAIALLLGDETVATIPIAAVVTIRERAAWTRSST